MDYYSMTDKGIGAEIGSRVRSLRLRRNLTQQQVGDRAALSLNAIKSLESGKGKLLTSLPCCGNWARWTLSTVLSRSPRSALCSWPVSREKNGGGHPASG